MKQKLLLLTLAAALLLAVSVPAFAGGTDEGFSDVDPEAWYAEAVSYCQENGLMAGTSATTFEPDASLTRAMLVTVLHRAAGEPAPSGTNPFTDVEAGAWYTSAVLWAQQSGYVSGYGNGLFGTNDPVTREQMAVILWRYAGSPDPSDLHTFSDGDTVASYAVNAVNWADENSIIAPVSDDVFAPKRNATRAQAASALMNLVRLNQTSPAPDTADGNNILIAYFSFEGHTKQIAEEIHAQIGGDLFEITPENPYTGTHNDLSGIASAELRENARPALSTHVSNMDQYDMIFVGYPCWWSNAPMVVFTFLEEYDFSGKMVVPFTSYGESGWGRSLDSIAKSAEGATIADGFAIQENQMQDLSAQITTWLQRLDLLDHQ